MPTQYVVTFYPEWKERMLSAFPPDKEFSALPPAVFSYLDTLELKTVVEESEYIDRDYSAAYTHFYSSAFRPPRRACTRYLLFQSVFSSLQSQDGNAAFTRGFAGFITVWPTYPPVIGRSVLLPPDNVDELVEADYEVHVAGKSLSLTSAMFASKDHGVAACASVATWLATDLLHRAYDLRTCSSAEVTLLATGVDPRWGRPFPQTYGLDAQQITRALGALDYGPLIYYFDSREGPTRKSSWIGHLYGYLSSNFPVIIMCSIGGFTHAVVAVGFHAAQPSDLKATGSTGRSFARRISSIRVHDDRWGPFASLEPDDYESISAKLTYPNGAQKEVVIKALIVPLPRNVVLFSEHAHALGVATLTETILASGDDSHYDGPFRTCLKRSIDLKRDTWDWPANMQEVASLIRETPMPSWVWITEAYPPDVKSPKDDRPFARVILDSTQLRFAKSRLWLGGHVNSRVFLPHQSE